MPGGVPRGLASGIPGGVFIITGCSVIKETASLPEAINSIFTLSVADCTTPKGRTSLLKSYVASTFPVASSMRLRVTR